ncbi:MAG: InlB B-repeat-containing protein [Erysipelotrichaceae bacterium]|jgi:uncharacterized repeat protein (TIGR02543 family)|nr:InlB B-repeat-containing protein [Erysipelotrichaceae bacterium]
MLKFVLLRARKLVLLTLSLIILMPFLADTKIQAAEFNVTFYVRAFGGGWTQYGSPIPTANDGEIVFPTEPDMTTNDYGSYLSFLGWSTNSDPDEDAVLTLEGEKITGNIELYAVMSNEYKIEYRYSIGGDLIMYKLVSPGMSYPRPSGPELENANFTVASNQWFEDGWQTTSGTEIQFGTDLVYSNATLIPVFYDAVQVSFNLQGGTYNGNGIDPIKVKKGSTFEEISGVPLVAEVSKVGTVASYWSLSATGSEIASNYIFNADTVLHVVYSSDEGVPYQIVYWVEKPNLGVNFSPRPGNANHYNYGYSVPVAGFGLPGQTIGGPGSGADIIINSIPAYNYFDVEDPMRWAQWQDTEPTTISADGTTIVNVYCSLRVYRIIFEITDETDPQSGLPVGRYMEYDRDGDGVMEIYNQSTPYSFDFKFGDKINTKWPHPVNGALFHHENDDQYSHWNHPDLAVVSGVWQTPRTDITAAMMPASPNATGYVVTLAWTPASGSIWMYYWAELLPGELEDPTVTKREYNGTWWALLSDYSAIIPDTAPDIASKAIPGFQAGIQGDFSDTPDGVGYTTNLDAYGNWHNYVNHYYLRTRSNLYYNMEGHGTPNLADAGIAYSESINPLGLPGYESIPYGTSMAAFDISVSDVPGWRFLGWYQDAAGTLAYDFSNTMPSTDLTLFAKWESTDLTVTFMDSDGSTFLGTQGVQMYGRINFSNLTFNGIRYVLNEYNDPNKGALVGWEYIPYSTGGRVPFDTSTTLWRNETLYAVWQSTGLTVMYHSTSGSVLEVDDGENDAGYNLGVIIPTRDDSGISCSGTSVFVGWRIDGTGAVYNGGDNLNVIGNLHMYPYCANENADLSDLEYVENEGHLIQYVDGYGTVILSYVALDNDFVPKPSDSDLSSANFIYPSDKVFEGEWIYRGGGAVDFDDDRVSSDLVLEPVLYNGATIFFNTYATPADSIKVKEGLSFGEVALPDINSFSRTGYHPVGWSLLPGDSLSDPTRPELDLIDPSDLINTSEVHLYLKWAGNDHIAYHITYWVEKPNLGANFTPTPGNINHYDVGYIDPTTYYGTAGYSIGGPTSAADIIIDSMPAYTTFTTDDPMHWAVWQATLPTVIAGDGSTIVNVYVRLKKYTMTFNLGSNNYRMVVNGVTYDSNTSTSYPVYTIDYKFGQTIDDIFPHPTFGTTFSGFTGNNHFYMWGTSYLNLGGESGFISPRYVVGVEMMPVDWDSNGYTVTLQVNSATAYGLLYWLEILPEQDCDRDGLICQDRYNSVRGETVTYVYTPVHTGTNSGYGTYHKAIFGFDAVPSLMTTGACTIAMPPALPTPGSCSNFFYDRVRATFYYDLRGFESQLIDQLGQAAYDALVAPKTLMYGQSLSDMDIDIPNLLNQQGQTSNTFIYWSSVSELTYEFDFSQTMPVNDLVVYALFESTDHTVTFRDSDNSPLATDGSDKQGVKDGGTVRFDGLTIGDVIYIPGETFDPVKGVFLGWQTKSTNGTMVDFHNNTPIYSDVTLYAKWQSNGLYVVYHNTDYSVLYTDLGDGGQGYSVGTQVAVKDKTDSELSALTIPASSSFVGWRINGTGLIYKKDSLVSIDGIIHLYPLFNYTSYPLSLNKVEFYSNTGASGSTAGDLDNDGIAEMEYTIVNGNNFYLPEAALLPLFKKSGSVLKGWSTKPDPNENGAVFYPTGAEIIASGNQTFYAVYGDALSVTYHDNTDYADLSVPLDESEYLEDQLVYVKFGIDSSFIYNGKTYTFRGWSSDEHALSATYTFDGLNYFAITQNTDLYAVWEESYSITYLGNGFPGVVPVDNTPYFKNTDVTLSFDINSSYAIAESEEYFLFVGWDEDPQASDPTYKAGGLNHLNIQKDVVLYAIWQPAYLVVYNGNGFTGVVPMDTTLYVNSAGVAVRFGLLNRYTSHDNHKYKFAGWNQDPLASEPIFAPNGTTTFAITANTILYAIWDPLYMVTYDANGYDVHMHDDNEYDPQDAVTVLFAGIENYEDADFSYTFLGWDTDPDAEEPTYTEDGVAEFVIENDTTLYAIYRATPKNDEEDRDDPLDEKEEIDPPALSSNPVPLTGVNNQRGWLSALWGVSLLGVVMAYKKRKRKMNW